MRRLAGLLLWAARDARRRPGSALLTSLGLGLLITLLGALAVTAEALDDTTAVILQDAPSLVVRRLDGGGWAPMPDTAASEIRGITGVTAVAPRLFGPVAGPDGPLTVYGTAGALSPAPISRNVGDDEVIVGPGVQATAGDGLLLRGAVPRRLRVAGKWPEETAMITQDIAVTSQATARALLGIRPGYSSDLAVWVYRDEEASAIIPDLQAALGFPAQITLRDEALGREAAFFAKRSGLTFVLFVPAILGLALLVAAAVRERLSARGEIALLKALGWTTGDVATAHLLRALLIGAPGILIGTAAAYASAAFPGVTWPLELFFDWDTSPPGLVLTAKGGLTALAAVVGGVLVPWLVAAALPVWTGSAADPSDLLRGG
jgi:hypothetical protein